MSLICAAASETLALDEEDVFEIRRKPLRARTIERSISIQLQCKIRLEVNTSLSWKLDILDWSHSKGADLCGVCNFCGLVHHALQQTLSSNNCDWDFNLKDNAQDNRDSTLKLIFTKLLFPHRPTKSTNHDNSLRSGLDMMVLSGEGVAHGTMWSKIEVGFEFFGHKDDPAVDYLNICRRPLQFDPLSSYNITNIRAWLLECDENHVRCWVDSLTQSTAGDTEQEHFVPTRLLHIGAGDQAIRLVQTSGLTIDTESTNKLRYIALSYCWGSSSTSEGLLRTTSETLDSRLQGIDFDIIPQAFKDTITVGRALGIGYLWIDSLTIIQDDTDDWQRESGMMAEIFSNAHLVIIAAQGSSYQDSLFKRNLHDTRITVPSTWIAPEDQDSQDWQVSIRFRRPGTDKMCQLSEYKWVSRGWTFQEERLARRALTFGEEKIFLDCRTSERFEDTLAVKERPNWVNSLFPFKKPSFPTKEELDMCTYGESEEESDQVASIYENWQLLCRQYSFRRLTVSADKLPAISGLARKFAQKETNESKYLAGLWEDDLLESLFWYLSAPGIRPIDYRAPSWSWASLDGGISWLDWRNHDQSRKSYCSILHAETTPLGLDPLGSVKDGYIKISGPMLKVNLTWDDSSDIQKWSSRYTWCLTYQGMQVARAVPDTLDSDGTENMEKKNTWALLFDTYEHEDKRYADGEGGALVSRGILLQSNGQERDNSEVFHRIGIFQGFDEALMNNPRETFWKCTDKRTIVVI